MEPAVTPSPALPISHADIRAARGRIRPYIRRTPLLVADPGLYGDAQVTFKLEHLQHAGSSSGRPA